MALADIIQKIESDAREEADGIVAVAQERATAFRADAGRRADTYRSEALADAEIRARREADRVVVTARLAARDRALAQRRELVDEALMSAADALAAASDAEYADFLAARIASVARGGETLRMGSADTGRVAAVLAALGKVAPSLAVTVADEPASFERGALVEGKRVRADLSLASIVNEHRDELELIVASALFDEED